MKIVVAIDSMKGCLTSWQAAQSARRGILRACPQALVTTIAASDGGEGMLEACRHATPLHTVPLTVHDPLMRPVTALLGVTPHGDTAIVEMAQASGLTLVAPHERNPLAATSLGTGEMIAHALGMGCRRIIVGLGGSATCDCGAGLLQALGARFSATGVDLTEFLPHRHPHVEFVAACDVDIPLLGSGGAMHLYSRQKGATPAMTTQLEARATRFAALAQAATGRDEAATPGAGAAGGTGFALRTFCGATMQRGGDLVLQLADIDRHLAGAALAITGEGRADLQALHGKLPAAVLHHARRHGVPTALLAGQVSHEAALLAAGFAAVRCINAPGEPLSRCLEPGVAMRHIERAAQALACALAFPEKNT